MGWRWFSSAHLFFLVFVVLLEKSFHERRIHRAGANAVYAHPAGIIDGKLARHGDHRPLGGAISEAPFHANQAGDGADVHDRAPRLQQLRHGSLRDEIHAFDVHFEETLEVEGFGFLEAADQSYSGVVDKYVEARERGEGRFHCRPIRNVQCENRRAGELPGHRFGARAIDIGDRDNRSSRRKRPAGSFADPTGAPGHQGRASVQTEWRTHHVRF